MGGVGVDESEVTTLVPGVSLYQINDKGIDIQADWGGMKYFKDSDLNWNQRFQALNFSRALDRQFMRF